MLSKSRKPYENEAAAAAAAEEEELSVVKSNRIDWILPYHPFKNGTNPNYFGDQISKKFLFQIKKLQDEFSLKNILVEKLTSKITSTLRDNHLYDMESRNVLFFLVPSSTVEKGHNSRMFEILEAAVDLLSSVIILILLSKYLLVDCCYCLLGRMIAWKVLYLVENFAI